MNPLRKRSVFRYFVPADAFVRILVCDSGAAELRARPGLDRAGYRRLVIQSCCPEFRGDLPARLSQHAPEDPFVAEDLLYQLCIEVNPALDIHTVRLCGMAESADSRTAVEDDLEEAPRLEHALERLHRRSRNLEERLGQRIIGQDDALAAVVRAVRKGAAGLSEVNRPLGTFLFIGRTGTGKTELARALARELYGPRDGDGLVRVDCSEFALAHEYSKLIGAPPGYVGHEHGGFLTDAVRREPESLVLFDEVEKAHPRLHNLLLSVLDDGHLSDSRGRRVDFSRTLIVMTSNVGATEMVAASHKLGFRAGGPGASERAPLGPEVLQEITARALEQQFAPEFLGRIGERVLFRELDPSDARKIAGRLLTELCLRARRRGSRVACSTSVAAWVAERGFQPESGARELRRVIQREIEDPLAELLLSGRVRRRQLVRVSIRRGKPALAMES